VIAAASTDEKCALCKSIGADATINYSSIPANGFRDAIKAATDGKGPDVIYDPVGGDFAEPAFRSIAWRGRYLVVGFAAGPIPSAAAEPCAAQGRLHRRRVLGRLRQARAEGQRRHDGELAQWYAQGKVKPVIDRTMPMAELKAAYAHMGSRGGSRASW
jgi:NADPH2:quinone reductase